MVRDGNEQLGEQRAFLEIAFQPKFDSPGFQLTAKTGLCTKESCNAEKWRMLRAK